MILSLDWGVAGAATATVIGSIYACVFYLCYFLRGVVNFLVVCTTVRRAVLTAAYYFAADRIISVFINDADVIQAGVPMLRALMLSMPVLRILFVLQAMGRAAASLALAGSRQGFVFVPCLFLFNALFGLDGIIFTQPIADLFSVVMSVVMFITITRKLTRQAQTA